VEIYHVIKEKNKLFIFMENCGRQTLSGLLRKGKILEEKLIKKYFQQIVQAVKYIHSKGISHRDLKP
jgi:serine/threonine protein kinase